MFCVPSHVYTVSFKDRPATQYDSASQSILITRKRVENRRRIQAFFDVETIENLVKKHKADLEKIAQKIKEISSNPEDQEEFYNFSEGFYNLSAGDLEAIVYTQDCHFGNNKIYPATIKFPEDELQRQLIFADAKEISFFNTSPDLETLIKSPAFQLHFPRVYAISDDSMLIMERLKGCDSYQNPGKYFEHFNSPYDLIDPFMQIIEDFADDGFSLRDVNPFNGDNFFYNTKEKRFQLIDTASVRYDPSKSKEELIVDSLDTFYLGRITSLRNSDDRSIVLPFKELVFRFMDKYPDKLKAPLNNIIDKVDLWITDHCS